MYGCGGGKSRCGEAKLLVRRKFETNIPRNELRGLVPNLCIYVSVSDLYILMIGPPILLIAFADRLWEYINR
jgi:hypothetical protein